MDLVSVYLVKTRLMKMKLIICYNIIKRRYTDNYSYGVQRYAQLESPIKKTKCDAFYHYTNFLKILCNGSG